MNANRWQLIDLITVYKLYNSDIERNVLNYLTIVIR